MLDSLYLTPKSLTALTIAFAILFLLRKLNRVGRREPFLPPGPPTKFLFGNIQSYPKAAPHLQLSLTLFIATSMTKLIQPRFTAWAEQYGEIYSLKLAHRNVVVLNSLDAVHDIMERQSTISSDRPPNHIKDRVEGQNNHLGLARYGDQWRALRRAAQQVLSPTACRKHLAIQQAESIQLLYDLLKEPDRAREHLRRYATSVVMSVFFGVRFPLPTSQLYLDFWNLTEFSLYMTAPNVHPPVDTFPILKYVPERWASWKTKCRELKAVQNQVFRKMLKPVEERLERKEENGAFMEEVYTRATEWGLDEDALLPFGFVMMVAGSETTSSFLQYFMLYLSANPRVQQKVQQEMDAVVGQDTMPVLDDYERLPYLKAVINETHRIRPVVPSSIPHAASEDIRYKGYVIPKGSIIFQNTWGMLHDGAIFENPETFYPERFIENPQLSKYAEYAFGAGRRVCVGIHLAENSLRLNAMNIVWAFNLTRALNSEGKEIAPDFINHTVGLAHGPKEMHVAIKPRSKSKEQAVRQAYADAEESFRPFEQDLDEKERKIVEHLRRTL